jgi:hypothetical protein
LTYFTQREQLWIDDPNLAASRFLALVCRDFTTLCLMDARWTASKSCIAHRANQICPSWLVKITAGFVA